MVSFTSITSGIFLISILVVAPSYAAPAATSAAPHTNATYVASFTLPPIIASRTKPISNPGYTVVLDAETQNIAKNKKWFEEHGGSYKNVTKRDSEAVGGMTMDLPTNAPSVNISTSSTVITASSAQIANFKNYAGIASTAYCRSVVPLGGWSCTNCLKYVPDGKLIVTFSSLLADTNGFVLRSDSQKTIHLVFRGTNSIRSAITVRITFLCK